MPSCGGASPKTLSTPGATAPSPHEGQTTAPRRTTGRACRGDPGPMASPGCAPTSPRAEDPKSQWPPRTNTHARCPYLLACLVFPFGNRHELAWERTCQTHLLERRAHHRRTAEEMMIMVWLMQVDQFAPNRPTSPEWGRPRPQSINFALNLAMLLKMGNIAPES